MNLISNSLPAGAKITADFSAGNVDKRPQSPQVKERRFDDCNRMSDQKVGESPKVAHGPRYRCDKGVTPLMLAARAGNEAELFKLLLNGADAALQDEHGNTALFYAAQQGSAEAVRMLARHDETLLSHRNMLGETAATVAARNEKGEAWMALIDKSANLYEPSDHKDLLEHAVQTGDRMMLRELTAESIQCNVCSSESAKSLWQQAVLQATMFSIEKKCDDMSRVLIEDGMRGISLSGKNKLVDFAVENNNWETAGILLAQSPILYHVNAL